MLTFGEQLYRLVGPKDNVTQPLELATVATGGVVYTGTAASFVATGNVYTAPLDRITMVTGFGALLLPDGGSALALSLSLIGVFPAGNAVMCATQSGYSGTPVGQLRFGTPCNVILPPGTGVQLIASFNATAVVGHSMSAVFIQGWTVPRGSISLR